jgi:hypothetical protein
MVRRYLIITRIQEDIQFISRTKHLFAQTADVLTYAAYLQEKS